MSDDMNDLDAIKERNERASRYVADLCMGKRRWTMTVPVDLNRDDDIVIGDALRDSLVLAAEVRRLRERVAWLEDEFECEECGHNICHPNGDQECEVSPGEGVEFCTFMTCGRCTNERAIRDRERVAEVEAERNAALEALVSRPDDLRERVAELEGALRESCDEHRSVVLSETGQAMCPLAHEYEARVAELEGERNRLRGGVEEIARIVENEAAYGERTGAERRIAAITFALLDTPHSHCEDCGTEDVEVDGDPILCWPCADKQAGDILHSQEAGQ